MQRRFRANVVVQGVLVVAIASCGDDEKKEDAASPEAHARAGADGSQDASTKRSNARASAPEPTPLVPEVEFAALGARPGHVAGGLLYLSLRAAPSQAWGKMLPWPKELRTAAAGAVSEIGFHPLATDWLAHFAVPDDAVISATLLRPIDEGVADAQARMETIAIGLDDDPWAHRFDEESALPPARASAATIDAVRTAARDLLKAAAHHSRVHVPSRDPARTRSAIVGMFRDKDRTRGAEACAGLEAVAACVAEHNGVVMLRELDDAVVVDVVILAVSSSDGPTSEWRPTLEAALAEPSATIEHAQSLAGDAAMWVDPAPLGRVQALMRVGYAMSAAAYTSDWPSDIGFELSRVRAFAPLTEAPRIFPGVQIEVVAQGEDLHARATWPVSGPLWGRMGASMIATPPSPSPVPNIEALCDGAVLCFRTQGIPDLRALSKTLATKGFAGEPDAVARRLGRDDELGFLLVLAGGWANLLAAGATFPDSMTGAQAGVVRTIRDAVMRAEGWGGSIRSLSMSGFLRFESDYVLYSRAQAGDIGAATGLLALAGEPVREIDLPDGRGKASLFDTTLQGPRAQVLLRKDEGEVGSGWMALADGPDRFAWLLALPSEPAAGPSAYLELPDLLALLEPFAGREVSYEEIRAWLRGRRLRFELDLSGAAPRLRAALTGPA